MVTYQLRPVQIVSKFPEMIISSELWVPEEGQGGDESETLAWEELIMKEDNWEDQEDVGEAKVWQCL